MKCSVKLGNNAADLFFRSPRAAKAGKVLLRPEFVPQLFTCRCKILIRDVGPKHHVFVSTDAVDVFVPKAAFEHGAGFINDPVSVAVPKAFIDPPQSVQVQAAYAHRDLRA